MTDNGERFTFQESIPRARMHYTASDHLLKRIRMKGRFITEELVRELIEDGELGGNRPGKGGWIFTDQFDGVEVKLVCDIGADLEARIVTGISEIVDRETAMDSDRWGKHKVQQVDLRKVLSKSGNQVERSEMKRVECTQPIDVKGHRIITASSWETVKCLDCGLRSRSKSELAGTPCDQ